MSQFKKDLMFVFYLVAGIVLGALLAHVCTGASFLSWLAYYVSFGIDEANPLVLDLAVLKLTFGLRVGVYVAQIFTIGLALFIYNRTRLK